MKLVSLTLENIKSYVLETINFYEGVNFISGMNGAGKSTIIEAIGYALFDAHPFSAQRQFIREGEKSGTITVVFEAADERIYRVERRLRNPTGGAWVVFDEQTGTELSELHGSKDVKAWLAEAIGMAGDLEPVLVFEDIIGVSQGRFIAPFLEKASERKRKFNTILQLESYRLSFEKTRSLEAFIQNGIMKKENEKEVMAVKTEDYEECKTELAVSQEKAGKLKSKLGEVNESLKGLEEKINTQEQLRIDLEKNEKQQQLLQIKSENLRRQREKLAEEIKNVVVCCKKAEAARPAYEEYCRELEIQRKLEDKRKKRDTVKTGLQALENKAAALCAELNAVKENRAKQEETWQKELEEVDQEGRRAECKRGKEFENKLRMERVLEIVSVQREHVRGIDKQLEDLRQAKAVIETKLAGYYRLVTEEKELEEALKRWQELEQAARNIESLAEEYDLARQELQYIKTRMDTLEENKQASQGGLCPFLQMPCKNVEGDLTGYFEKEIAKILPRKTILEEKVLRLEKDLAVAKKAQEELLELRNKKQQWEKIRAEQDRWEKELLTEQTVVWKMAKNIEASEEQKRLQDAVQAILKKGGPEQEQLMSELRPLQNELEECLQAYGRGLRDIEKQNSSTEFETPELIEDFTASNAVFIKMLEAIRNSGESFWNKVAEKSDALQRQYQAEVNIYEERLDLLRQRYKKIKHSLSELKQSKTIENKTNELSVMQKEILSLQKEAELYQGLDVSWEKNRISIEKLQPMYRQYVQNSESAEKEKILRKDDSLAEAELQRMQLESEEVEKRLSCLREDYSAELLVKLRKKREELLGEKGQKEEEFKRALLDAQRYQKLVEEKEELKQRIRALEKKLETEKKAQELLGLIRRVLNKSGEKMAQVYRQYLGREADMIYRKVAGENVLLYWGEDYDIKIVDVLDGQERERVFSQLSGGEKMTAALAVRLALLKYLSGIGLGFFDEPTANLDETRRTNLARLIPEITASFRQVFVISHDDSFDYLTENVIMLKKLHQEGTKLVKS